MEENNYCVYMHICPNGKKYIGVSNNINRRWGSMGQEYSQCKKFYYAIRKFGWLNIKHKILEENINKETAYKKEKEYISKYQTTNCKYGYNMTTGGSGVPNNSGYRRVEQYDITGKYIRTFDTCKEAANSLGLKSSGEISKICRKYKGHVSSHGFIFRYEGDSLDLHLLIRPNCIEIYQLDENKTIINKFPGLSYASKYINCDQSVISKAITRRSKTYGYYWCKSNDYENFVINKDKTTYKKTNYTIFFMWRMYL